MGLTTPKRDLVSQRAIHLPPSRLGGSLRGIHCVLHFLSGIIETLAGLLSRAFLMAGGQAQQQKGTRSNRQRNTHRIFLESEDRRNDARSGRLHGCDNVAVVRA